MKTLKGWRTVIIGLVLTFVTSVNALDLVPLIPSEYQKWALAFLPPLFVALRFVTTTKLGEKQ